MDKQTSSTIPEIIVEGPGYAKPELSYTAQVVFGDFLGLPWKGMFSGSGVCAKCIGVVLPLQKAVPTPCNGVFIGMRVPK